MELCQENFLRVGGLLFGSFLLHALNAICMYDTLFLVWMNLKMQYSEFKCDCGCETERMNCNTAAADINAVSHLRKYYEQQI